MINLQLVIVSLLYVTGTCTSDYLTIKEGKPLSLVIDQPDSAPGSANSTNIYLLTFDEYNEMSVHANDSKCNVSMRVASTEIYGSQVLLMPLNELEMSSFAHLYPADDRDIRQKMYEIPVDCENCTIKIDTEDDELYENEESFVLVINERKECAIILHIIDNDAVQFSWSTNQMGVYENESIVLKLLLMKSGESENTINITVNITRRNEQNEAQEGREFDLLQHVFVFDNATSNLSVPFEVHDDTVGVIPKHFYLTFHMMGRKHHLNRNLPMSTVKIYILNSIEFATEPRNRTARLGQSVLFPCSREIEEGRNYTTKPHWWIRFLNGSTTTNLPPNHRSVLTGLNVTAEDIRLNLTSYTCFYDGLVPDPIIGYRPKKINSTTGTLTILFPATSFSLERHNPPLISVSENISFSIIKRGGKSLMFNVTLGICGDAIIGQRYFLLSSEHSTLNVTATISDKYPIFYPTTIKIFIVQPIIVEYRGEHRKLITEIGDPLNTKVYSNVYYVGFAPNLNNVLNLASQRSQRICAVFCKPDESYLLDPSASVQLQINLMQDDNWFGLKEEIVTLSNSGLSGCFNVSFKANKSMECNKNSSFTVGVTWKTDPHVKYSVHFCQRNTTITAFEGHCTSHDDHSAVISLAVLLVIWGLLTIILIFLLIKIILTATRKKETDHEEMTLRTLLFCKFKRQT